MVDVEEREVVPVDVGEPQLGVVGRLLGLVGAHEALRHRQHRRDRQDLIRAVVLARRDQHLGQLQIMEKQGCHDVAALQTDVCTTFLSAGA